MSDQEDQIALDLLLEVMDRRYGYDFKHYAQSSFTRRVQHYMNQHRYQTPMALAERLLYHEKDFLDFVNSLSITVTEMFRDVDFFKALRESVIPHLKTFPSISLWHAGCATGEEVYSVAIVMREQNLSEKVSAFATDLNQRALHVAEEGIYNIEMAQQASRSYLLSGGLASLSDYYHAKYGSICMDKTLAANTTFSCHNLVTDQVFNSMNIIICPNVLIYFDKILQSKVLKCFRDSLQVNGFLCLGNKESLRFSEVEEDFEVFDAKWRIYRLKRKGAAHGS